MNLASSDARVGRSSDSNRQVTVGSGFRGAAKVGTRSKYSYLFRELVSGISQRVVLAYFPSSLYFALLFTSG